MRKLIMKMSVSIDGFVAGPNGEKDWAFKYITPDSKSWTVAHTSEAGMVIMGRKTFEVISSYWPTSTDAFAPLMNEIPKALFTQKGYKGLSVGNKPTAAEASWANTRILDGDLADEVNKLKSENGKPILAIGGAGFMRNLIATGLVDEYYLVTHPVVLGAGLPIFDGLAKPMDLKLEDVKTFSGGIMVRIYSNK